MEEAIKQLKPSATAATAEVQFLQDTCLITWSEKWTKEKIDKNDLVF